MDTSSSAPKKLRVLIIAELCNPEWVSVPLVGWNMARHMGDLVDVHLVTSQRNQENIDKNGFFGKSVTYIDQKFFINFLVGIGRILLLGKNVDHITFQAMTFIFYPIFELRTWWRHRKDFRNRKFDLVHRVTPLSPVIPSILAPICKYYNIPFIFGPINGGLKWPEEFKHLQSRDQDLLSPFRSLVRLLPFYQSTRRNSAAIIVGSNTTLSEIAPQYLHKCHYMPENGLNDREIPPETEKSWTPPLNVLFVGRLVALKGVDMALEGCAALLKRGQLHFYIIGEGPEFDPLKELAAHLGVSAQVTFTGWVDRKQLPQYYEKSHIFAFLSVKEFGGGALVEAMSFGLVPLVVDYGGPGEIVVGESGFKIPMASREKIISRVANIVEDMVQKPHIIQKMSQTAKSRIVEEFRWTQKAKKVLAIYKKVVVPTASGDQSFLRETDTKKVV